MSKRRALFSMVLASVFWSIAGLFIKQITWHPLAIAGFRSLISGLFLFVFIDKKQMRLNKTILLGGLMYTLVAGLFVAANKLTTTTNAILLQFTAPIWVVVICVLFLRKRFCLKDITAVLAVAAGMVLFFLGDLEVGNILGNVLAICAGVALAVMLLIMRKADDVDPLLVPVVGNFMLFAFTLPFIALFPPSPTHANVVNILVLGILQLGMGYLLFSVAVPYVSTLEASLIMVIEPLMSPVWVFLFLGEAPTLYSIIGGVIVVLTVFTYQIGGLKSES